MKAFGVDLNRIFVAERDLEEVLRGYRDVEPIVGESPDITRRPFEDKNPRFGIRCAARLRILRVFPSISNDPRVVGSSDDWTAGR
jgi:hypothetical protein